jgi:threonine/homoserine/homoserine lactone efflux protein
VLPGLVAATLLGLPLLLGAAAGIGAGALGIALAATIPTIGRDTAVAVVVTALLGLGALLATSEFWFAVVKWAGAAYLAFLGVTLLRSQGTLGEAQVAPGTGTPRALFRRCFLVAVTNPKGYLFFSAFLPQFVDPGAPQAPQFAALAAVFVAIDLGVMLAYAALGSRAVRMLKRSGALWLDRLCGSALIALAGSLAFMRRAAS